MQVGEKRVTLAEIARQAGVSVGTAAKVLSGTGGNAIRVGKETGERIQRLAAKLDYQPNHNARILVGKKSNIIGLLIDSQAPLSTFRILSFIEKNFSAIGYQVMIAEAHNDVHSFAESCRTLRQYGVEGIIALSHDYPDRKSLLKEHFAMASNIVFVGRAYFDTANYVDIDRAWGINQAFDYLWDKGRRRLGMAFFNNGVAAVSQRLGAFLAAAERHNVEVFTLPVLINNIDDNIERIMAFAVEKKLDALFTPDDFHAVALPVQLAHGKLLVPKQIAIVGYDNEPFARLVSPQLTTIDENAEAQAAACVDMLRQILDGKSPSVPIIRNTLIVREST